MACIAGQISPSRNPAFPGKAAIRGRLWMLALGLCLLSGCKESGHSVANRLPDRSGGGSTAVARTFPTPSATALDASTQTSSGLGLTPQTGSSGSSSSLNITNPGLPSGSSSSLLGGGNSLGGGGNTPSLNFPTTTPSGPISAAAVPEPGAISLLLGVMTSAMSLAWYRRARHR